MNQWRVTGPTRFVEGVGMVYPVTKGGSRFNAAEEDELKALLAGWISVDDELPPMGQHFDAWHVSGERLADHGPYVGSWDEDFRRQVMRANGITHWMVRPAPPTN